MCAVMSRSSGTAASPIVMPRLPVLPMGAQSKPISVAIAWMTSPTVPGSKQLLLGAGAASSRDR